MKTLFGCYPLVIRFDGDTEFKVFKKNAEPKGIAFEETAPYTYEQHGVAERAGGYLVQMASVSIIDTQLPPEL